MFNKPKKIWESIFKDKEYARDFTGKIILKDEYKTGKEYSWDFDKYDYNEEDIFIASEDVIKVRNKQPIFEYNNEKFISVRNLDFSYSILSPLKIVDNSNPLNFDLYLANMLANYKSSNYIVFSITYKKMVPLVNDIFISFISQSLKSMIEFEYMKIENGSPYKNKLFFLIDKNKYSSKKALDTAVIFKSLIQLFILRSINKFETIWAHEEDINIGSHFNLFLFETTNKNENIFISNEMEFVNYVETFENRILLNKIFKKSLEDYGMVSNEFTKLYDYDQNNIIYSYDFLNNKFNSFFLEQKNKK